MNGKPNHLEGAAGQLITEKDLQLNQVLKTGITQKDVAQISAPTVKTAAEAVIALKIGNTRFFSG